MKKPFYLSILNVSSTQFELDKIDESSFLLFLSSSKNSTSVWNVHISANTLQKFLKLHTKFELENKLYVYKIVC